MAEQIDFIARYNDAEIEKGIQNTIDATKRGQKAFDEMGDSAEKALAGASDSADALNKSMQDAADNIGSVSKEQEEGLKRGKKGLTDFGKTSDRVFDRIESKGGKAGEAIAKIGRIAGPVGTVIAGVAAAIATAFLAVDENAKSAKRELEGLKVVGNELKDRVFAGLRGVIQQALGNTGEAAKEIAFFLGRGRDSLADIRQQGKDFFDFQSRSAEISRELQKINAERANDLQRVNLLAGDENRVISERIGLIRNAAGIEADINRNRILQVSNEIATLRERNRLYGEEEGSLDQIAGLEAQLITLRGQHQNIQLRTQQQINALLDDQIKRTAALNATLGKAIARLGGPAEEAKFQYEQALEAIKLLEKEARKLGVSLDFTPIKDIAKAEAERFVDAANGELKKLPGVVDVAQAALIEASKAANETLDRSLQKIKDTFDSVTGRQQFAALGKGLSDTLVSSLVDFEDPKLIEDAAGRLAETYARGVGQSSDSIIDSISISLTKAFDLTEDQLGNLVGNLGVLYNGVTEGILADTERQITAQDQLVQAIENRVNETTRLLQIEQERAADGYANNVELYKKRLEDQQKAQQQAEAKRLDLEKKAARERLVLSSIEQASQIALAAAKLTAAEAGKGIIGLGIALAGLGLIFKIVSQAKAQSQQFTELPRFREGTEYVTGPGTATSDSVLARLSVGERVVDAGSNAKIPRGTTNKELVDNALLGLQFKEQFKFHQQDFSGTITRLLADQERIAQAREQRQIDAIRQAHFEAADKQTAEILAFWESRPFEWTDKTGNKMLERKVGGTIERKIFKQEQ